MTDKDPNKEITESIALYNPDIIYLISDKFTMANAVIQSKIPYIYEPYDFFYDSTNASTIKEQIIIMDNATKIISRYDRNVLHTYEKHGYYVEEKNVLEFFDYCTEDNFTHNSIKSSLSIIHAGYISALNKPKKSHAYSQFDTVALSLSKQKISFDFYTSLWSDDFKTVKETYCDTIKQAKGYFTIHQSLSQPLLQKSISSYMYGSYLTDTKEYQQDSATTAYPIGNKVFTYLEAGLPIIVTNNSPAVATLVKKYNIGICIDAIDTLTQELETVNYSTLVKNVLKHREKALNIQVQIPKLINVLKEIANV